MLRRIIRRAVRHAYLLGAQRHRDPGAGRRRRRASWATPTPTSSRQQDLVTRAVRREEERFRQTLERGLDVLDDLLGKGDVAGGDAFFLHDTLGFPIDLTREIAEERGRRVDVAGFAAQMQRPARAGPAARKAGAATTDTSLYRDVLETSGPTEFTGRVEYATTDAAVVALVVDRRTGQRGARRRGGGRPRPHPLLRRSRRPGRRYRHPHRSAGGRARPRHDVRAARARRAPRHRRAGHAGRRRDPPRGDRRRAARPHPPQPHGHPPAPLGAARGARGPT